MLGTIMASNVFFRIIPAQSACSRRPKSDARSTTYGARAKQRSTHNHTSRFRVVRARERSSLYSHKLNWAILGLIFVGAAGAKYVMNCTKTHPLVFIGTAAVASLTPPPGDSPAVKRSHPRGRVTAAREIIQPAASAATSRPSDKIWTSPPVGVVLERPSRFRPTPRILFRVYDTDRCRSEIRPA
jgi:uncharacterized membrane protein